MTRIITAKITYIIRDDMPGVVKPGPATEIRRKACARELKTLLEADNVVVSSLKDFPTDDRGERT